ncbi:hypothetical protein IGS68_15520 [Skermanella sp. TT6]|uniref:Uncharacterized protein n=1 Tax=Skermanella cutis TaxID=2775420 RepID=A0ABX7B4R1_9PROT|nr:hypothetical protein [Skermanella sp. TT6]QQP87511.1 hypothetical protein IGS68_15520 [Skermanella sp. TT6]
MSKPKAEAGSLIKAADPTKLAAAAERLIDAYKEWMIVREQETTKRELIAAQRDAAIAKICADRDVLVTYLKGQFETQGKALDGLFKGLDKALDSKDPDLVGPILSSIVETVKTSPLGDMLTLDQRMKDNSFTFVLGGN